MKHTIKHFKNLIEKQDIFAFPIRLEVSDSRDGEYRTFSGGTASIFLNTFLLWFFIG